MSTDLQTRFEDLELIRNALLEQIDDLDAFDPQDFADALMGLERE